MRISFQTVNRNMQSVINKRYGELARLQEQISTGRRLLRPSDDPVDVANTLKLKTRKQQIKQFRRNIEDGLGYMNVTETAMDSMNNLLQRMRELGLQASSDTIGENERKFILQEVDQLSKQMITLAVTQFKGDYIFSGTQTKIPPLTLEKSQSTTADDYENLRMSYFMADGLAPNSTVQLYEGFSGNAVENILPGSFTLSYQGAEYTEGVDYTIDYITGQITLINPDLLQDIEPGGANYQQDEFSISFEYISKGKNVHGDIVTTQGEIKREIESGITMPINITLDEVFNNNATGNEMITTILTFAQALHTNDHAQIQSSVDNISSAHETVLAARAKNGARVNRFEITLERNEHQLATTTELQSTLEDTDMAEAISRFMLTENVYNAALKSVSRVIQPSLVNFL
ncbi:flagellar hook-associated protein FlgL [Chitinispirillales bacterium ANBcel5]|uniref:flagellar hook-associated protein FlgL n=1 Tax=Cellulosispirillum alkaliphilum TaxID=3039283 RepID=UPI002A4E3497|nr:flagellar hook-associated protein FlgL [Chitinispirillales bacterium ANBcel5]